MSISGIFAGIIFGLLGMWLIKEGKRQARFSIAGIGLALCLYPYFVEGGWLTWGIGLALIGWTYHIW